MKILNLLAVFLSAAQIVVIVYFLLRYRSDNMPFFVLLIVVPMESKAREKRKAGTFAEV